MFEYIIIAVVALAASLLTFFSGFGLGTILTPVFILFLPIDTAIAATAIVHFLNNIFKLSLVGITRQKNILIKFGIPAMLASFAGAWLLLYLSDLPVLYTYALGGRPHHISWIKLSIAVLMIFFTFIELLPNYKNKTFGRNMLTVGGLISGFFGGLSGHQGALRSMFLLRTGISKEDFIATGIFIACMVDVARLGVYSKNILQSDLQQHYGLILVAVLAAFIGAFAGNKLLKKTSFRVLQWMGSTMLLLLALLLAVGIV